MGLHIFWPATACLTLFVVGVIMILLKRGTCTLSVFHRKRDDPAQIYSYNDETGQAAYERDVSYSETAA